MINTMQLLHAWHALIKPYLSRRQACIMT